ncbi:cyt-4 [Hyphodiscus hymeniophilus]|uniref:Cyt-4 n=1 Tax=Hyphodiscus hymeniophilus TaxID=353542 RepID=A0A9P6VN96_9HELO|nr:cyt-4 [Hyphodiscus hymeniophilus]
MLMEVDHWQPSARRFPGSVQGIELFTQETDRSAVLRIILIIQGIEKVQLGVVLNNLTHTDNGDHRIELDEDETENDAPLILYDDLVDVGDRRGFLLPGDLVELRAVVGQAEQLAIYVREVENQSQFYTMSGKWIHRSSQSVHFFVPHFVDSQELDDILPYLPTTDVSSTLRDKLQDLPPSVPRDAGKALIRKMLKFWAASDAEYQASSPNLDNAHERVAHNSRFSYATLEEIAKRILPATSPEIERGTIPPTFFTLSIDRFSVTTKASGTSPHSVSVLEQFAIRMRNLIDLSRKTQPFTVYGTILPSELRKEDYSNQTRLTELRDGALDGLAGSFILFLESWVALSSFGYSSSLNGIGSEILRAIQRYDEANLDRTTGWTFLQEIGQVAPWENRLSYELRLPGVGRRLKDHVLPQPPTRASLKDSLKGLRKDFHHLPVFCIDDPGAHEIDDGISIEATDIHDEYWVHVHTADPSSYLTVGSEAADYAETFIENVYMPEQAYSMIPPDTVMSHFSLAPGRPTMTFSARMNKTGHIIDMKITPGRIKQVLYLSPAALQQAVHGTPSTDMEEIRAVGSAVPDSAKTLHRRTMMESHELSDSARAELQLLDEIGAAHAAILRARGGVDQNFPPRPKIAVQVHEKSRGIHGDSPRIALSTVGVATESNTRPNQGNLVQSFMLVAAQVAARWCNDRGIPVPYRVTPRNPAKEDPSDFFIREVLPSRAVNGMAPIEVTSEYLRLIGGVLPSITPGPHAAVGVDMMARWSTLLEEARLGQSLVGNTRDDFLPFSKARVEALLPRIDTREKLIKHAQKEADRQWLCIFLLRAWQLKETELPPTMPFLVRRISIDEGKIFGMLTDFSTRAHCSILDEMDLEKIQLGETLDVELDHIDVYERKIQVKIV